MEKNHPALACREDDVGDAVVVTSKPLADPAKAFLQPSNSTHRQYEALRSFFVDQLPSKAAAVRFGYSPGSFRGLVLQFPSRPFFLPPANGPHTAPKSDPAALALDVMANTAGWVSLRSMVMA